MNFDLSMTSRDMTALNLYSMWALTTADTLRIMFRFWMRNELREVREEEEEEDAEK